jgi:penicillin-binding protein 1C
LKPFIYGLGFEDGLLHPETLIDDRPARYGSYTPENFDLTFQGTVTVRRALQLSLNVPAIAVLGKVGVSRLSARLAQAGATLVLPKGEAPGLAMGLGGVGIRLSDLVMLYSGLARLGLAMPLIEREGVAQASARRLLDPVAAWYVGSILIGAPPPENAPHGRIAFKTGTSYGFRDAWAVGFDGRMTVGVWVGRPDGAPVAGLVGRAAAAPILFDAFARSGMAPAALPHAPKGAIFAATNKLPPPLQRFSPASGPSEASEPPRIMFPPDGARIEMAGGQKDGQAQEPVVLKLAGGAAPLTFMVNGVPQVPQGGRRTLFFQPDGPGFVRLTVMDARGAADSVMVRVQ